MKANELLEKVNNSPATIAGYEEVLNWCNDNIENINFEDESCVSLYEMSMRYLMKAKIGNWAKQDVNVLLKYLARDYARESGIEENINVKILDLDEYQKVYGEKSSAICTTKDDGSFDIAYSSIVEKNLMAIDPDKILKGMQTIFHEVVHAMQNTKIYNDEVNGKKLEYTGNTYRMALETMFRELAPQFYHDNYKYLLKENQAEYLGLIKAMSTIEKYNSKLYNIYNIDEIKERLNEYNNNCYWDNGDISFADMNVNAMGVLEMASDFYVKKRQDILEKYPVLKYAFNDDGNRKGIIELIEDREKLLQNGKTPEQIDDLFSTIANYKSIGKTDIKLLDNYIATTGANDEFVFGLLKYRLDKTNLTPEQVEEYMKLSRKSAEIASEVKEAEVRGNNLKNELESLVNSEDEIITAQSVKDSEELKKTEIESEIR